jgi:RNA polymerase sigma-70 factor, ECF subfamily
MFRMSSPDPEGALALDLPIRSEGAAIAERDDVRAEVLSLFDECAPRLRRYARSCGLTPQAADDVIQDTFVQLYRHLCLGRSRQNLHGWLFTVCHRLARKQRARTAQRVGRESWLDPDRADAVLDPADDPERQLARLDHGRRLRAAIRALPERHRQCLQLRAEGLGYRDIARVLGISLGAVAKALAHVVFRLSHVKE